MMSSMTWARHVLSHADVFNDVGTTCLVACYPAFDHRYGAVPLRH
jgi:hypothetical protein